MKVSTRTRFGNPNWRIILAAAHVISQGKEHWDKFFASFHADTKKRQKLKNECIKMVDELSALRDGDEYSELIQKIASTSPK